MDPVTLLTFALFAASSPQAGSRPAALITAAMEDIVRRSASPAEVEAARYEGGARQVSNWRLEAADDLEPRPLAAFAALVQADRPVVTRCVRLNNYWCIKSARWAGEVGTDEEGHVGFASAEQGADAAATLLRRYYLEFGRKSAFDIVRRWAPAECGTAVAGSPVTMIGVLAVRGLGGTLRARYLASRRNVVKLTAVGPKPGRPAAARASRPRVSVVIPRALPTIRVPDIASEVGVAPILTQRTARALPAKSVSAQAAPAKPTRATPARAKSAAAAPAATRVATADSASPAPAPMPVCTPDEQRLRNYAARIAESVGAGPEDDLKLFTPDGAPTDRLAPVMLAMSSVELGLLRASQILVAAAVDRQADRARAAEGGGEAASEPRGERAVR